jgi:sulfite reductase alpha subunit-like flavoprotein
MENRKLRILYGSETGTASDIAEELWRESKKFHFESSISAMDNYQVESLISEELVIFVASTTGQGEEPYNMKNFWKFLLRKSLPRNSLSDVNIAVLGLGDSSYQKFNFVGKRLFKRLVQLSAKPILSLGLCDDQHDMGLSAVYLPWKSDLWQTLLTLKPLPIGLSPLDEIPQQFKWNVTMAEDKQANGNSFHSQVASPFPVFEASVLSNVRTTADDHFQDVRLISFSTEGNSWEPGDVVYVRPQNSKEQVDALFELFVASHLSWYPDTVLQIEEITRGI